MKKLLTDEEKKGKRAAENKKWRAANKKEIAEKKRIYRKNHANP